MHDTLEEIEALKARAFRPPQMSLRDDIILILRFLSVSLIISFLSYGIFGLVWLDIKHLPLSEFRLIIIELSFWGTIIFGILRTLRLSMAQIASDAYMIFPMHTQNVRRHLRDLIVMATTLQWDLTGLIGSLTVLLVFYFVF